MKNLKCMAGLEGTMKNPGQLNEELNKIKEGPKVASNLLNPDDIPEVSSEKKPSFKKQGPVPQGDKKKSIGGDRNEEREVGQNIDGLPKKDETGGWLKELIIQPIEGPQSNFYHIKEQGGKIGRHSHNELVIYDESVSRYHAQIIFKNNEFYLKDIGSTTGTYTKVNNLLNLTVDMIIEIGSYQFLIAEIHIHPKSVSPSPEPQQEVSDNQDNRTHIKLEVYDGPEEHQKCSYTIYESGSIGRKVNNHICFADDLHMSNIHCKIILINDNYFLEDMSSTNGYPSLTAEPGSASVKKAR